MGPVPLIVEPIAQTILFEEELEQLTPYQTHKLDYRLPKDHADQDQWEAGPDELAEFAGRNCYLSFGRPNPKTRSNKDYLAHIIEIGHESVLEHSSVTFYIEASRSVLTELERHRHLSFSVVSQRYVDASELGHHVPPAIRDDPTERDALSEHVNYSRCGYREAFKELADQGLPRKQAREAARAYLPSCMNSPMVVTGNMRTWRHVVKLRNHPAADAEIQEVAGLILEHLKKIAPNTFQDL